MTRRFQCLVLVFLLGWPALGRAAEAVFTLDGAAVQLDEATNEVAVFFQAMRFNRAARVWNVEVALTNTTTKAIPGPFVVLIDGFSGTPGPLQTDGFDERQKPFYNLTATVPDGVLLPGERSGLRTLALGFQSNAVPHLVVRVYARTSLTVEALGLTRSLNEMGQPLGDVQVLESGSQGQRTNRTDSITGVVTLGQGQGMHQWIFTSPDYLPVWRSQTLQNGEVAVLPNPRLTRRDTNSAVATPQAAGSIANRTGTIQVSFAAGAFAQTAAVTLTPLTGQTLPALLPLGWSPLQAGWLEIADTATHLPLEPSAAMAALLKPWGPIAADETAVLVKWSPSGLSWEVRELVSGKETNAVTVHLPGNGAYALVVGDAGSLVSPALQLGKPLPARSSGLPAYTNLMASGTVEPAVSVASRVAELVTANATVTITNPAGPLPSGLPLRCEVKEVYRLRDGTRRFSPQYETFLAGYQRPGNPQPATLQAQFPLRPLRLFGAEELDEATLTVDVMAPVAFAGGVLGVQAGSITVGGVRILVGAGDLTGSQAVQVRALVPENFSELVNGGVSVFGAFELTVTGVVPGRRLGLQWSGAPSNSVFVLARVLAENGFYGLQPIERLASDINGTLRSLEAASGEKLPGLNSAGQYVLTQVSGPQGLVTGAIRNAAGQLAGGLPVRITGQPWLTLSAADGSYRLVAPTGRVEVAATDLTTGDSGFSGVTIADPQIAAKADVSASPSGPRVAKVTPADGAANVARVTSVVVEFSKPINPGSLGAAGIQLVDTNNQPVAATLTLNLQNTIATLLPTAQLAPQNLYTIRISASVTGPAGLPLEGTNVFAFTTETDALNRVGGQVTSYEPTNGVAKMEGSPGTADPESAVILINQTSGRTATILSKPDGSFSNFIEAEVDDFLSAVIVNKNGTRNTIPVSRQLFRDGSVGLFNGGGILEAQSDGGPVQVLVEPGAIESKVKLKITPIPMDKLVSALETLPANGKLLGGVMLTQEGDDLKAAADISFPVDVASLGLTNGATPDMATFALVVPREVDDVTAYEIIDSLKYEGGRLVTKSPPFTGALLRELQARFAQSRKFDKLNRKISKSLGLPDLRTAFYNVALLPLLMAQGHSVVVVGTTQSAQPDATGQPLAGTERLLPGATVTFADEEFGGRPGRLQPGATFTTSGSDGRYSIIFPINRLQENGFIVRATHPAMPFGRAVTPITVLSIAQQFNKIAGGVLGGDPGFLDVMNAINNALTELKPTVKADLTFLRLNAAQPGAVADNGPPSVSITVSPRDPAPGTNATAGAVITVSGQDDLSVGNITLHVEDIEILTPGLTSNTVTLAEITGAQTNIGSQFIQNSWRLQSTFRANVRVKAVVNDAANNISEAVSVVTLAGDRVFPGINTNDTFGPRVLTTFPRQNASGVRPATPVFIQLSEAVSRTNLASVSSWLTINGGATLGSAELSSDGKQLTVHLAPSSIDPTAQVSLTLNSGLTDLAGNPFDQDPQATGSQSFSLQFSLITGEAQNLTAIEFGGGAVYKGAYAYVLERLGPLDGALVIYDLRTQVPTKLGELHVPGYPRDLALVPDYSYVLRPGAAVQTNDLIAVVGGKAGAETFQYLWVIDVSNPSQPVRLAGAVISLAITAVTKVEWSPPFLAYLESGADITSVSLVDLQTFIIGMNASQSEIDAFPIDGSIGVDANRDGDYVDAGDTLPIPERNPVEYFGKLYSIVDPDTTRQIEDFDFNADSGLLGLALHSGFYLQTNGVDTGLADPSRPAPPAYRTAMSGLIEITNGTVAFPIGLDPKRVAIMHQVLLASATNQAFRDLAIVSLTSAAGSSNSLAVIDITNPNAPTNLVYVDITAYGAPQSLTRRDDGLLGLATFQDVLLLDPTKFLVPPTVPGTPAALVGIIPGAGSGARSYVASDAGVNIVNLGGRHQVVRTAPNFRFLNFPTTGPIPITNLLIHPPERIAAFMASAQPQQLLQKSRFFVQSNPTNPPALNAVNTNSHYYIRVDALGSLGGSDGVLNLVVESLNGAGSSLVKPGPAGLPVRLGTTNVLQGVGDTNWIGATNALVFQRAIPAQRLSTNAASALYNVFLAGPFALTDSPLSSNQLAQVQQQLPRAILRAGRFLWVGLDPATPLLGYPSNMLSQVAGGRISPGASLLINVAHIPRPVIFIPGIAGSFLDDTNDFSNISNITGQRWLGLGLDFLHRKLSLTNNPPQPIGPTDAIRYISRKFDRFPIYANLLDYLTGELGYVEYDYRQGSTYYRDWPYYRDPYHALTAQMANNPDLFVYPYDWRQDNADSARQLKRYLELIRIFNPELEKVDIIAHSNGGLVARRFILDNPGLVEKCITIGTPWLGAPKGIIALETGDFDDFAMNLVVSKETLRDLAEHFPGVQQLMPSKAYFDLGAHPIRERNWDANTNGTIGGDYTYTDYKNLFDAILHPNAGSNPIATNEAFHGFATALGSQDDWRSDSTGVEHSFIYGVQAVPRTIGIIELALRLRPLELECSDLLLDLPWKPMTERDVIATKSQELFEGHQRFVLDRRFEFVRVEGDGTVPALSASMRYQGSSLAPNVNLFPIISPSPDQDEKSEHNGMLRNTNVLQLVRDILAGVAQPDTNTPPAIPDTYEVTLAGHNPNSVEIKDSTGEIDSPLDVEDDDAYPGLANWVIDRLLKGLVQKLVMWVGEDSVNKWSSQYLLVNSKVGNTEHTLTFQARPGQPFSVNVRRWQGTNVTALHRWLSLASSVSPAELKINWASNGVTLKQVGSSNLPPTFLLTQLEAHDQDPPQLTNTLEEVNDNRLDIDDDIELDVRVADGLTSTNQPRLYLAYDQLEDGDPYNDLYRPVRTNLVVASSGNGTGSVTYRLSVPDFEMQSVFLVGEDSAGNPSLLAVPRNPTSDDPDTFRQRINAEKAAVTAALQAGLQAAQSSGWILPANPAVPLPPGVQSILEQGSGAAFWTPDPATACKGIFTPDSSDHDYEVFMPVFSVYSQGLPANFVNQPYDRPNIEGDWYFKGPVATNGNTLLYRIPGILTNTAPYIAGARLKTPANFISEAMLVAASNSLKNANFPLVAKNVSFFAARIEHFANGLIDLELPMESGSDPVGDVGTGRQMLMLKWVLEGEYVPLAGLATTPTLDDVFRQLKARGIKPLEGYEWGVYQEFAALSSGLLMRTTGLTNAVPEEPAHDYFYDVRKGQLKKAGKAAIRATLGLLVANGRDDLYMLSRAEYRAAGYRSYEQFIAGQASRAANYYSGFTVEDIGNFAKAKLADKTFLGPILKSEQQQDEFLNKAVRFCRKAQIDTKTIYVNQMALLSSSDERDSRASNLQKVRAGFPNLGKPGLDALQQEASLSLIVRGINDGPVDASGAEIKMDGPTTYSITTNLLADTRVEIEGEATNNQPFFLKDSATQSGVAKKVVFTIKGSSSFNEANTDNNWFGFYYYILDTSSSSPQVPVVPPISKPSSLPAPDADCIIDFTYR